MKRIVSFLFYVQLFFLSGIIKGHYITDMPGSYSVKKDPSVRSGLSGTVRFNCYSALAGSSSDSDSDDDESDEAFMQRMQLRESAILNHRASVLSQVYKSLERLSEKKEAPVVVEIGSCGSDYKVKIDYGHDGNFFSRETDVNSVSEIIAEIETFINGCRAIDSNSALRKRQRELPENQIDSNQSQQAPVRRRSLTTSLFSSKNTSPDVSAPFVSKEKKTDSVSFCSDTSRSLAMSREK